MDALIGYTGTVGKSIKDKKKFSKYYNSKNISDIFKYKFDLVVCAGAPGSMVFANKFPTKDKKSINNLILNLEKLKVKKFILISTTQIYDSLSIKKNEFFY